MKSLIPRNSLIFNKHKAKREGTLHHISLIPQNSTEFSDIYTVQSNWHIYIYTYIYIHIYMPIYKYDFNVLQK